MITISIVEEVVEFPAARVNLNREIVDGFDETMRQLVLLDLMGAGSNVIILL